MTDEHQMELSSALEKRFPDEQEVISDAVERVQKARLYEYTDHLDLHDVDIVVSGIENWAQGQGLIAGWNRWVGVGMPNTDSTHLTVE